MQNHEKMEELTGDFKKYVTTSYELIKLEAAEATSVIGSEVISELYVSLAGFIFILFISVAAGFFFSDYLSSKYMGFGIVAGVYFLLWMILKIGRKSMLEKSIRNKIIYKIFNKK
jgi:hypothetical protein